VISAYGCSLWEMKRLQGSLRLATGGRGDEYLDNSRYRGSAAAGGWAGDYRGSMGRISVSVAGRSRIRSTVVKVLAPAADSPPGRSLRAAVEVVAGAVSANRAAATRRAYASDWGEFRDNIAGGVSDGGFMATWAIAGRVPDGRSHQRNRRRAGLTTTAVIAYPRQSCDRR
jgi:hypothetical protein